MSSRALIAKALVAEIKKISVINGYKTDLWECAIDRMKFWDEINQWPMVCVVPGQETREYLPSRFQWGFLGISLKLYVKNEDPTEDLENLITDIEKVINDNGNLIYGPAPGQQSADINITSIITDEGILVPYGIAEVNIIVQYQVQ